MRPGGGFVSAPGMDSHSPAAGAPRSVLARPGSRLRRIADRGPARGRAGVRGLQGGQRDDGGWAALPGALRVLDGKTCSSRPSCRGCAQRTTTSRRPFIVDDNAGVHRGVGAVREPAGAARGVRRGARAQGARQGARRRGRGLRVRRGEGLQDGRSSRPGSTTFVPRRSPFAPPPKPDCWVGEAAATAPAAVDAGAPDAGPATMDAGAVDAGAAPPPVPTPAPSR